MKVDELLSPHFFPQWAYEQTPGVRNGNIGFIDFNVDHPKAREAIEKWLRAFVPTIKDSPALFSYCLSNEPAYVQAGKDEFSRPKFVAYLRAGACGEIAKLNAARMGRSYKRHRGMSSFRSGFRHAEENPVAAGVLGLVPV